MAESSSNQPSDPNPKSAESRGRVENILGRVFRRQSNSNTTPNEPNEPQASSSPSTEPIRETLHRLRTRVSQRLLRGNSNGSESDWDHIAGELERYQRTQGLINEAMTGFQRMLVGETNSLPLLPPIEPHSHDLGWEQIIDADPPTDEQIASLTRRELETPNPLINSQITPTIRIHGPDEDDRKQWRKRSSKRSSRPEDSTLLNSSWEPEPSPTRSCSPKKRWVIEYSPSMSWSGPPRTAEDLSKSDTDLRNLICSTFNTQFIKRLTNFVEADHGDSEVAKSKLINENAKKGIHALLEHLTDMAMAEVLRVEAKIKAEVLESGSEEEPSNRDPRNSRFFRALRDRQFSERGVDRALHRLAEDLAELVLFNEVRVGLEGQDESEVREKIFGRQKDWFHIDDQDA